MSTAIAGKKLSTKSAEWAVRQRGRQLKAHPDCRSTTIKLTRHENIPCVIVGPRQSSSPRDRPNSQPDFRCVLLQNDALQARVLFRWKQDLTEVAPLFVAVEIVDTIPPTEERTS